MNLETEYLSGDIVMAKVEGFPHWPAIVIEVTEDESYRVVFFVQGKEALLGANDLKKFEGREETISETGNKKYKQLNEAISLAENVLSLRKKRGYNAMEENLLIRASQSSFQENKSKKVEKKRQLKAMEGFVQKSKQKRKYANDLPSYRSPCAELRGLFQKLSVYLSHCWNRTTTQKGLNERELDHLRKYLSLQYKLQIKDVLNEWIVQQFIIILKELEQAGSHKYNEIFHLTKAKYRQLVNFIESEQFNTVEVNQRRRNNLFTKIHKNRINIY